MDDIKQTGYGRGYFIAIAVLGPFTVALAALFAERIISPAIRPLLESHRVQWWLPAVFSSVIFVILNFVISTASVKRYLVNFGIIIAFKVLLTVSTALIFMLEWDATTALAKAAFYSPVTALLHVVGAFLLTLFFSTNYFAEEELEEGIAARFAQSGFRIPEMEEAEEIEESAEVGLGLSLVAPDDIGGPEEKTEEEVVAPLVPEVEAPVEIAGVTLSDLGDEEVSEAAVPEIPVEETYLEEDLTWPEGTAAETAFEEPSIELPETSADDVAKYRDAVLISVESIMSQIPEEDVGMSLEEVKHAIGSDTGLWFPLAEIVKQLPEGEVKWDASEVLSRLPDGALGKPVDEVAGKIPGGHFQLPLDEIIKQVPGEELAIAGEISEEAGEELPDLFAEVKGEEKAAAATPAETMPEATEEPEAVSEVPMGAEESAGEPEPAEPAPVEPAVSAASAETMPEATEEPEAVSEVPVGAEESAGEPEPVEAVPVERAAPGVDGPFPEVDGFVVVRFESILGQLRPEDVLMSAEEVKKASGTDGLSFPISDVLRRLAEGIVRVDAGGVLVRLPEGALERTVIEVAAGLPDGKIELPLSEIVPQLPKEAIEVGRPEPAVIDEMYPDLFHEGPGEEEEMAPSEDEIEREAEVGAERVRESVEPAEEVAVPSESVEEAIEAPETVLAGETVGEEISPVVSDVGEADEKKDVVFVSIESILSQVPQEDLAMSADEIKTSGADRLAFPVEEVVPGLAEGEVKWDAEDVLSRLPEGALSKPASDVAKEMDGGMFELPLEEIVRQVPPKWLELEHAIADERAEEIPDIFHEGPAEAEEAPVVLEEARIAEAPATESVETEAASELEEAVAEGAAPPPLEAEMATVTSDGIGAADEVREVTEPPLEEAVGGIAESAEEEPSVPVGDGEFYGVEDKPALDDIRETGELIEGEPDLGITQEAPIEEESCQKPESAEIEEGVFEPPELRTDGTISLAEETPSYEPVGETGATSEPSASPIEGEEVPLGEAPYVEETALSEEAIEAGIGLEEAGATVGSVFSMADEMGESGENIGGAASGPVEEGETAVPIGERKRPVPPRRPPSDEEEFDLNEECIRVSARYVLAQLPRNALGMSIDLIETKLKVPGNLLVPQRVVIPQLGSGLVEVDFVRLLPQFPKRAFVPPIERIVSKLPDGKVEVGMKEVILQLPLDVLLEHENEQPWEEVGYVPELAEEAPVEPTERRAEEVKEAHVDEAREEEIVAEAEKVTSEKDAAEAPEGEKEEAAFEPSLEREAEPLPHVVAPEPDGLRLARDSAPLPEEFKMDLSSLNLIPPAAVEYEAERAEVEQAEPTAEEERAEEKVFGVEEAAPAEGAAVSPFEGLELIEGPVGEAVPEKVEFVDYESEAAAAEGEVAEKAQPAAEREEPGDKALTGADIEEIEVFLEDGRKEAPTEEESLASMFGEPTGETEAPAEKAVEEPEDELEKIAAARTGVSIEGELEALPPLEAERKAAAEETAAEVAAREEGMPSEAPEALTLPEEGDLALKNAVSKFGRLNLVCGDVYRTDSLSLVVLTDEDTAGAEVARSTAYAVKMLGEFMAGYRLGDLRKAVALGKGGVVAAITAGRFDEGRFVVAAERDAAMAGQLGVFIEKRIGVFDVIFGAIEEKAKRPAVEHFRGPSYETDEAVGESFGELMSVLSDVGIDRCVRLKYAGGPDVVLCYPSDFPEELLKSGTPLFAPSSVVDMLDNLDFGPFRSIIFVSDKYVVTYSAVAGKVVSGVLCVFPGPCREGLAKLKSEKVSGVISARRGEE